MAYFSHQEEKSLGGKFEDCAFRLVSIVYKYVESINITCLASHLHMSTHFSCWDLEREPYKVSR